MTRLSNGDGRMIIASETERRLTLRMGGGSGNSMPWQVKMARERQGRVIRR